ncbi:MAG: hypothetical protein ACK5FT_07030 [Sphingomonadales bacterium]
MNKAELSEMLFHYVITRNDGVRMRTMKGCVFHFTRYSPKGGSLVKGINVHRESGFLHNRKNPFDGKFFKEEFLRWVITHVSINEMYKTINKIDGLAFPD